MVNYSFLKFKRLSFSFFPGWIILFSLAGCQVSGDMTVVPSTTHTRQMVEIIPSTITATLTLTPEVTKQPTPTFIYEAVETITPTVFPTIAAGQTRKQPLDGMVQVYVPEGAFTMGSQPGEARADADEFPQHEVYLAAFWIDQTEVTNQMFTNFLNEMGNQQEGRAYWLDASDEDAQIFQSDSAWEVKPGYKTHPAVEVNWFGANAYCQWVGRLLPSEAQWEKAARGTMPRKYPSGNKINCSSAVTIECKTEEAQQVGTKPAGASPFGVLDMAGNVWEWVADWYAADYYSLSPIDNPAGPEYGEYKGLRGGSFAQDRMHARSANRRHNGPANSQHDYGFRCVSPTD